MILSSGQHVGWAPGCVREVAVASVVVATVEVLSNCVIVTTISCSIKFCRPDSDDGPNYSGFKFFLNIFSRRFRTALI